MRDCGGLRGQSGGSEISKHQAVIGGLWEAPAAGIEPRVPLEWLLGLQLPVVFYFVFISHVSVYERFEHFEWPFRLRPHLVPTQKLFTKSHRMFDTCMEH